MSKKILDGQAALTPGNKVVKLAESKNESWLKKGETLICFGDSLTAAENGYVDILREYLEKRGIKVINCGRGGDKTPWALTRLQSDVIDMKPDAVSIFLGTNDAVIGHGRWRHEPKVSPVTYKENLIWMIYLCRLYGNIGKFSIATPAWRVEGKAFHDFGDIRHEYNLMAREASDDTGSLLVPLDAVFARKWEQDQANVSADGLLYTVDGTHMTSEGYRLIAETMLETWSLV